MRPTCLESIYTLAKQNERIHFIGSDLGFGVLDNFRAEMPDRFHMVGVSEQAIIGLAAGLALEGKIPFVNTISTFLTRRCYEQLALDVAMHNLKVRLIGNGGGAVYSHLGPTHMATDDISLMRNLGITCIVPADKREMAALMPQTVDYPGPLYIRLGLGEPIIGRQVCTIGGIDVYAGCDPIAIFTTGNMLSICLEARKQLWQERPKGICPTIIHIPTVIWPESLSLGNLLVFTVEEGITNGGLASLVAEHYPIAHRFGLPIFPEGYGTRDELLARYGLTAENIAKTIREM